MQGPSGVSLRSRRPPAHLERIANELYIAYLNSDAEIIAHVTKIGETEQMITYSIDTTRDHEGNPMVHVFICLGGEIIEEQDFYSEADADTWRAARYPHAKEDE